MIFRMWKDTHFPPTTSMVKRIASCISSSPWNTENRLLEDNDDDEEDDDENANAADDDYGNIDGDNDIEGRCWWNKFT